MIFHCRRLSCRLLSKKKEREQAVERERAELERVRTELQQEVARGRSRPWKPPSRKRSAREFSPMRQPMRSHRSTRQSQRTRLIFKLQSLEALKAISKGSGEQDLFHGRFQPKPVTTYASGRTAKTLGPEPKSHLVTHAGAMYHGSRVCAKEQASRRLSSGSSQRQNSNVPAELPPG